MLRHIHLIGCFLHLNELPLRHVFLSMDGKSTTPGKFSGPIGQELSKEIWKKPPVEFEPVPCEVFDIPEDIKQDLSTDQKLLYDYWKAISTGHLPVDVMSKKVGEVFHA